MHVDTIRFVKGVVRWDDFPDDGMPEIAFIGRSNVGKSSLLNMLVGRREIARTSGTPGKTQEFNYYLVNDRFYLVDLPGYGYARIARTVREKWRRFIGRYLTERQPLRVIFHLIDSRHPPTALDQEVIALMKGSDIPYILLLTKSDKLSGNQRTRNLVRLKQALLSLGMELPVIFTSAVDKRGRVEVLQWVEDLVNS